MLRQWLPVLRRRSEDALRPMSIADMMEEFWKSPFEPFPAEFGKSVFGAAGFPAVNISETDKEVRVDAELPGLDPKDVEVSLDGGALVIRGEKKFEEEKKKDSFHRIERSYGSFTRTVPLPAPVEAKGVTAKFEKGVLRVALPKAKPAQPAHKIQIEGE